MIHFRNAVFFFQQYVEYNDNLSMFTIGPNLQKNVFIAMFKFKNAPGIYQSNA